MNEDKTEKNQTIKTSDLIDSTTIMLETLNSIEEHIINEEYKTKNHLGYFLTVYLRDFIVALETYNLLKNNNKESACDLIIRALFEKTVYIEHISEHPEEAEKLFLKPHLEVVKEAEQLLSKKDSYNSLLLLVDNDESKANSLIAEKFENYPELSQASYRKNIKVKYKEKFSDTIIINKKLNKDRNLYKIRWYDFDGKTPNLRKLSEKYDIGRYYYFIYKELSRVVHGTAPSKFIEFNEVKNRIEIEVDKVFDFKKKDTMIIYFCNVLIDSILSYYDISQKEFKLVYSK